MQPRRSLRLVAGALVLALPLLGSCGFDKATDRVYTPAAGTNDRDGDVDVLAAVVVAAQPDSGTFMASLANNSRTRTRRSRAWPAPATGATSTSRAVGPVDRDPRRGFVNLADEDRITVTGDFEAGHSPS